MAVIQEDGGLLTGYNWFFSVDTMNEYAFRKHGFSIRRLRALSRCNGFADSANEIHDLLRPDIRVFGHNVESDIRMIGMEFKRAELTYRRPKVLDTMNFFARIVGAKTKRGEFKKPTLGELGAHYRITDRDVETLCCSIFGAACSAHDARFDAALTYLAVLRASECGDIRGVF